MIGKGREKAVFPNLSLVRDICIDPRYPDAQDSESMN
jgi:hypothetical protein